MNLGLDNILIISDEDIESMFNVLLKEENKEIYISKTILNELKYITYLNIESKEIKGLSNELKELYQVCEGYVEIINKLVNEIEELIKDENIVPKLLQEKINTYSIIKELETNIVFGEYVLNIYKEVYKNNLIKAQELFDEYSMYTDLIVEKMIDNCGVYLCNKVIDDINNRNGQEFKGREINKGKFLKIVKDTSYEAENILDLTNKILILKDKWLITQ